MHDQARLSQSLLALVPVDGSSIGNQSLFEQLSAAFPDLSQAAFVEARDALIAQGVLQKGRGRGGSVKRSEAEGSAVAAKPAAVKKPARSTEKAAVSSMDDLKKTLWATADKLRANMDAAEYKHIVLGLIFLKYISDSFASRRAELERKLTDESDDYFLGDDDPELLAAELEDRDYYREVNVFWVPEVARWESIRSAAKRAFSASLSSCWRLASISADSVCLAWLICSPAAGRSSADSLPSPFNKAVTSPFLPK